MSSLFAVNHNGDLKPVRCFLGNWDGSFVNEWQKYWSAFEPNQRSQKMNDSLDYAKLAGRKWLEYNSASAVFATPEQLKAKIKQHEHRELCGAVFEKANWYNFGATLGFALVRRTWCNHIAVDFLAGHPRTVSNAKDVKGIPFPILT